MVNQQVQNALMGKFTPLLPQHSLPSSGEIRLALACLDDSITQLLRYDPESKDRRERNYFFQEYNWLFKDYNAGHLYTLQVVAAGCGLSIEYIRRKAIEFLQQGHPNPDKVKTNHRRVSFSRLRKIEDLEITHRKKG